MDTLSKLFIYPIKFYQFFISPLLGSNCRFIPTCSTYALSAFEKYGPLKALMMVGKRILKCHPFHPGGIDPA